ncbi:MAG: HD domain-containing phosphohydrolase [Planctomycetota bacterium]|jgi:HD-GYP domain-containing protein (c-di-GMP phosphodiesterase class II)
MIALIALPTAVIYVVVLGLMMAYLRGEARAEVEQEMGRLAGNYAARFDGAFREAAAIARATARFMETAPDLDQAQIFAQLSANTFQNRAVYGAAMAFEPGSDTGDEALVCPYVHRGPDGLVQMNIGRDVYDWYGDEQWQWWHVPKGTGRGTWTDPYFDEDAGNVLMVTYAEPFQRDGVFRGVTTVDIMLPTLQESIGRQIIADLDYAIFTRRGRYVYSTTRSEIMGKTVFEVVEEVGRPDIAEAARHIVSGRSGVATLQGWDDPPEAWEGWVGTQWVFYAPIESTRWAFAALMPQRQALAGVQARMTVAALGLGMTLLLIIGCIWYVSGRIARPIVRLRSKVQQIAGGDLEARVEGITRADEIGDLAESFNKMTADLKDVVDRLAHEQASHRDAVIFALAKLAESRDDDTGKHLERICRFVEVIATELAKTHPEIDEKWIRTVTLTAALHDIGKVGIPDSVLCKPGRLTDEERQVIQKHPMIGGDTLLAIKQRWEEDAFLVTATEIAFAHHERWDGTGYPFGLAREDIALAARIVAVADVYDALTSQRVYKPALTHEEASRIITEGAGSHFDPVVVEAFTATEAQIRDVARELRR